MLKKGIFAKSLIFVFSLAILLISSPTIAQAEVFAKVGTAGMQFLKIGVGAKALGMGQAYTPYVKDASATYWNPAGIAHIQNGSELFLHHTEYVADIGYEYASFAYPTQFGTFALSTALLHMPYMDVTDDETFEPTGEEFTCSDLAATLTYANKLTDKFAIGISGKYLRQDLDEFNVNGWSIDLGSQYDTGWREVTIGMALRNFGPDLKYRVDEDGDGLYDEDPFDLLDNDLDGLIDEDKEELSFRLPMNFSLGLSANLYKTDMQSLYGVFQLDNCVDRKETYNLGLEYNISNFSLRAGKQFNFDAQDFSFGVGWKVATSFAVINIDVAYRDYGDMQESWDDKLFPGPNETSLIMGF